MGDSRLENWDLFRSTETEANSASEKNTVLFKAGQNGFNNDRDRQNLVEK
jgi:hypothetical protein